MPALNAEFNFGASGQSMGGMMSNPTGVGSPFTAGEFDGTQPIAMDDPEGVYSNFANPKPHLANAFDTPEAPENIPLNSSLSGTV